eukprot:4959475-Pleurochrysis_carterae.AAC.2
MRARKPAGPCAHSAAMHVHAHTQPSPTTTIATTPSLSLPLSLPLFLLGSALSTPQWWRGTYPRYVPAPYSISPSFSLSRRPSPPLSLA